MPHARAAVVRIEEPSKAIGNGLAWMEVVIVRLCRPMRLRAVAEFHWNYRGLHFFFAQQRVLPQGVVPFCEVFEVGIDAAIAKGCRSGTLVRFFKRTVFHRVAE